LQSLKNKAHIDYFLCANQEILYFYFGCYNKNTFIIYVNFAFYALLFSLKKIIE